MALNQNPSSSGDQTNPGQKDESGNELIIKKNEGVSDDGNEWSDEKEINTNQAILGEKAAKYIKNVADPEGLPDENDNEEAEGDMKK